MNDTSSSKPRLLCVDDNEGVVAGMRVTLRKSFDVVTATSGAEALDKLRASSDFAVLLTDMCMPGMSGAALLEQAQELAPYTARIVLTGQADLDSTVRAVNAGRIFRYLKKPCSPPELRHVCEVAAHVYQQGLIERNLARETLLACVDLLSETLMLASPLAFGRIGRLRNLSMRMAAHWGLEDLEEVGLAAALANLGLLTVPSEVIEADFYGRPLSEDDRSVLALVPETSALMLGKIPQSARIRDVIAGLAHRVPRGSTNDDGEAAGAAEDPWVVSASAIIRAAQHYIIFERRLGSSQQALDHLRRVGGFDSHAIAALHGVEQIGRVAVQERELSLAELNEGMVAAQDIKTTRGALLVARGQTLTANAMSRLAAIPPDLVAQPIYVQSSGVAA